MPVIMGTAGHIDHGKTTLVKALTGIDCDRLAEEKKRGITIELGFAFFDLPSGERLGIVDVPGHEKFVKNMVAGATGIDFVLLVIAADEGVMPQTREHLEICSLLGIETGLVALTKVDMVDPDWLELVREDVAEFLQGSFLEQAGIHPVSATTGQGLPELIKAIEALAAGFRPRRRSDLARLPVDRVFTMRGHGTVVTGALVSGALALGQDLELYPREKLTKVRGLQLHGEAAQEIPAGRRTAVNLQGLEVEDIERGDVLARPGTLFPSTVWDLEISCLSSAKPLRHRTEVHFHHGSREVLARLNLLDRERLQPGETALCQARFPTPLPAVYGDRVVIRSFSPLRTVAGGRVLNPLGRRIRRGSDDLELLRTLATGSGPDLILVQLRLAGPPGLSFAQLMTMTNLESRELDKVLNDLSGRQQVFLYDKEERIYSSAQAGQELMDHALANLEEFHRREPLKVGATRGAVIGAFGRHTPPKLGHFLLERLARSGRVEIDQDLVRVSGHAISMGKDQAGLAKGILAEYQAGWLTPPNLKDVLEKLAVSAKDAQPVLKFHLEQGALLKIKEDMFFASGAMEEIRKKIGEYFEKNEEMGPAEFRDVTGLSRKYAIPLLEGEGRHGGVGHVPLDG